MNTKNLTWIQQLLNWSLSQEVRRHSLIVIPNPKANRRSINEIFHLVLFFYISTCTTQKLIRLTSVSTNHKSVRSNLFLADDISQSLGEFTDEKTGEKVDPKADPAIGRFLKAMALGADAIAVSNSAIQAIGCLGMRACHTNNCPVGIAT